MPVCMHSFTLFFYFTDIPKKNSTKQERPVLSSWYAEIGLWDMSTSSPNDSSLSEQGEINFCYPDSIQVEEHIWVFCKGEYCATKLAVLLAFIVMM